MPSFSVPLCTAYGDTSGIRRIVNWSNQHLRSSFQLFRSRNVFHDGIQQRSDGAGRSFPVFTHPVVLGRTVDYREVQLVFCGVEAEHQVEHHFIYFFRRQFGLSTLFTTTIGFNPICRAFEARSGSAASDLQKRPPAEYIRRPCSRHVPLLHRSRRVPEYR